MVFIGPNKQVKEAECVSAYVGFSLKPAYAEIDGDLDI
jgi:hypothetical protein